RRACRRARETERAGTRAPEATPERPMTMGAAIVLGSGERRGDAARRRASATTRRRQRAGLMTAPGHPRRGDIIAGKYQVEDILGAGGMGVVVAARDLALRRRVAVKFLLPQATSLPDASERFLREARASVAIQSE